ncbi:MAG TPA: hypothetical protein VK324_01340 [Tepidisphaeraceae bacterium]|nr:hypothetical protein [Tepidisphaeraceae bacterium]
MPVGTKAAAAPLHWQLATGNWPLIPARELCGRWLDEVNGGRFVVEPAGRYDVARLPPPPAPSRAGAVPALLPAA